MRVVAISDKVVHGITMETSLGKRKKNDTTKRTDRTGKNEVFQSIESPMRLKIGLKTQKDKGLWSQSRFRVQISELYLLLIFDKVQCVQM